MKKYEILIVDDEKDVANAMRDALKILEIYNPTVALNGSEALGYIAQRTFDAFMVDQIMPEMTGTEFVRKLTAQVSDPLVYIITAEDDGVALSAAELQSEKGGIPVKK
jgi:two-component system response regulator VicR